MTAIRVLPRTEHRRTRREGHAHIVSSTLAFAPEAKGVRTHSLYTDSTLLPMYRDLGFEYDCSYQMPLVPDLRPFWKQHEIVEIPTYYADHFDLMTGATEFNLARLSLDRPGFKVFDFHPNIIFLNASDDAAYQASKPFYHDPERLLAARNHGRGVRTLLLKLIDHVVARRMPIAPLDQINACWRKISHDADTTYAGRNRGESPAPSSRSLATCTSENPVSGKPISVEDEPDVRALLEVCFRQRLGMTVPTRAAPKRPLL